MSEMMKLTDLNIDCLENILEYLKFGDLLNAASSNKRLNKAANYIIIRKSWHKSVWLKSIRLSRNRLLKIEDEDWIEFTNLKTSLQYIRCFGHLISRVNFEMSERKPPEIDQYVINYINEYCSNSLTDIRILNGLKGWEHLKTPFSNVKKVELNKCHVAEKDTLNRLFPNMDTLKYNSAYKSFFINLNHCPNLENLNISDRTCRSSEKCFINISNILRLNPQLEDIVIRTSQPLLDSVDIQNALKNLKNLQRLNFSPKWPTKSIGDEIHLKSVKSFSTEIDRDCIMKIPFLFSQLVELDIDFTGELNAEFFCFIENHPTVEDLTLKCNNLSATDLSKIAESLPSLISIDFIECKILANDAINFISKFQNLKKIEFKINKTDSHDKFQTSLSNEWECEIDTDGHVCLDKKLVSETKRRKID